MNYSKKHLKHIAYKCYNTDEYGEDFDTWYKRIVDSTKEIAQYDNCFRNQKKIWRHVCQNVRWMVCGKEYEAKI